MQSISIFSRSPRRRPIVIVDWGRRLLTLALVLGALLLPSTSNTANAQSYKVGTSIISVGDQDACVVVSGGGIKCWGINNAGQLGNGTTTVGATANPTPVTAIGVSNAVAVAAGVKHTCALTSSGGVMCWGANSAYGQYGNGTLVSSTTPVAVANWTNSVTAIVAGDGHTCAIVSGGVRCAGNNSLGQLGNGTTTSSSTPVQVTGLTSGVLAIAAGGTRSCAVTSGGAAMCWGQGTYGALGNGGTSSSSTPVQVTGLTSGVVDVSVGDSHSCALLSNGGVRCWGYNVHGELGDGTTTNSSTPVVVAGLNNAVAIDSGFYHTCVILTSGAAQCWGTNNFGQLGDGTATDRGTPTTVLGLSNVVAISAGGASSSTGTTCVVLRNGGVQCWGSNTAGQLGVGTTETWYVPAYTSGFANGGALVSVPLRASKSAPNPYPPVAGQPVSYSIVVTNTGTSNLTNVTVTDLPGPGLGSLVALTSSPAGTCNTGTRQCVLSSALAPGGVATIGAIFNTGITAGVWISNTGYVNATEWPQNVYATTAVPGASTVNTTNLAITKSATVANATVGTPFSYTITVTNNGTTTATNVKVKDNLPANVTYNSATASGGGSCTQTAGVLTCTWASLAAAGQATVTVNVTP